MMDDDDESYSYSDSSNDDASKNPEGINFKSVHMEGLGGQTVLKTRNIIQF